MEYIYKLMVFKGVGAFSDINKKKNNKIIENQSASQELTYHVSAMNR